jgi:hypothetical protein
MNHDTRPIFVFGSNLAGRHGKGSALEARQKYGAVYGQGVGMQGHSYGIPTKDGHLNILPIPVIAAYVLDFLNHARNDTRREYRLVAIGCGLASYKPNQIAPLFIETPGNCQLPEEFRSALAEQPTAPRWQSWYMPTTRPLPSQLVDLKYERTAEEGMTGAYTGRALAIDQFGDAGEAMVAASGKGVESAYTFTFLAPGRNPGPAGDRRVAHLWCPLPTVDLKTGIGTGGRR